MAYFRVNKVSLSVLLFFLNIYPLFAQDKQKEDVYYTVESSLTAQKVKSPFIIKTNPLTMLMSPIPFAAGYRIGTEFMIKTRQSLEVDISYLGKGPFLGLFFPIIQNPNNSNISDPLSVNGGRLQIGYKFYLIPQHKGINGRLLPYGLYLAPHFSISYAELHNKQNKDIFYTFQHSNLVAMLGGNFDFSAHINMDLFCGFGYRWNIWKEVDNSQQQQVIYTFTQNDLGIYSFPIKVYMGFNLGYAF